ncbi:MAG: peptide-methionine (S)-S-oxide reductase MsrA, partial [Candidatus Paceibacterota bacterium]
MNVLYTSLVVVLVVIGGAIYYFQSDFASMNTNTNIQTRTSAELETMLVAGGCFWCVEADLEKLQGVVTAISGYAGGQAENPTYENYAQGGHREVVEVTYDPNRVTFEEILIYAMKHMDPTDGSGSFGDRGEYYAPAFYYKNSEEKEIIETLITEVNEKGPYEKPLAIAVLPHQQFWPAEEYHQDYYKKGLSALKYTYYRNASGRDAFIQKYWDSDTGPTLPWRADLGSSVKNSWKSFSKPSDEELKANLTNMQYKVTQKNGTEPAFENE